MRIAEYLRIAFGLVVLLPLPAWAAGWADPAWPCRRAVDIDWPPPETALGDEMVVADICTAGLHEPSGESIRVAGEDGKWMPSKCVMIGPGDRLRVVFQPARSVRRYYIYFGHPKPPPAPRGTDNVPSRGGLLMTSKRLQGGLANNFRQIEAAWERSTQLIGRTLVPQLFLGHNPLGDEPVVISQFKGTVFAPAEGEYTFAAAASDRGALYIDGKPVLLVPGAAHDTRFNVKIQLRRGLHDIVFYLLNVGGEQRLSVAWMKPGDDKYELIPPVAFGGVLKAAAGAMERLGKPWIADMKIQYVGECYAGGHYTHRYRFTAQGIRGLAGQPAFVWDFGDGQTATGPSVEHVFLEDGLYAVKLTVTAGRQSDAGTNRIGVSRPWEQITNPPQDNPPAHARIVCQYDMARIPDKAIPWAVGLLTRGGTHESLERAALRLAVVARGVDANACFVVLAEATEELLGAGRMAAADRVWAAVPAQSPLQPFAARCHASLLMWRKADFSDAVKVIEKQLAVSPNDAALKRQHGQALILNQQAARGRKVLAELKPEGPVDRQAAMSGALARTIEFHIVEGDWESGEKTWERWQQQYPDDFLAGYSVLLRVRLMATAKYPQAAATVAEAFALAVPRSSYAPRLLYEASKLLAARDPARSKTLLDMLKQKYPEDPLSQE